MALSAPAYTRLLKALLPRGALWDLQEGSFISRVLSAVADELARIDGRSEDLIREIHPPTTLDLLPDFERVYGLPDPCGGEDQSTAQRIASVVNKVTAVGGQSKTYYIGVAARLGFTITIDEFTTADPFAWRVNSALITLIEITVEDTVEDRLATFGNDQLECVLNELKPAHTTIIFAYT